MGRTLFFLLVPLLLSAITYETHFVGVQDEAVLKSMFDTSDLVLLKDRPPASINGLRYRISSDIPQLLKVLSSFGYYDAEITSHIAGENPVQLYLYIQLGPQYTFSSYDLYKASCLEPLDFPFKPSLGGPALSVDVVNAELDLLSALAKKGYPLASIKERKVTVDMRGKELLAAACVDVGPLAKFGKVSVKGLHKVNQDYFGERIGWKEGAVYNSDLLEETRKNLLNTNLFSSVFITHEEELNEQGSLPMRIEVSESKHRKFSIGAFYATVDGFGGNFSWVHRNIRGRGEQITIDGEFSTRYLAGSFVYKIPEFLRADQTYRVLGEIERENINPYTAFTYRAANYFERKLSKKTMFAVGFEVEHINVASSANNGTYLFGNLPLQVCYTNADDMLNPTKGFTLVYQFTPYQSFFQGNNHFLKQRLTTTFYLPALRRRLVWAGRAQFGSIAGEEQKNIPLPILFLGGSEDDLRGYRYFTVSPVDADNRPLGGRSAIFCSAEARIRLTQLLGIVPFADFGTVTFNQWPNFTAKWFKSVGVGARIFTFFGPLRVDVGFPLDRRKHIDKAYRIYASVGQAF